MSFVRNTVGVMGTTVFNVLLGIVTSVVLARWLSVEDRGLYSVATNFGGIVALVLTFGWPAASIYRLRRIGSPPAQVASAALLVTVAASLVIVLLLLTLAPEISSRFLDGAPLLVVFLALAVVPFDITANTFTSLARGLDRFALQNMYRIGVSVIGLAAVVVVLVFGDGALVAALTALLVTHAAVTLAFLARVLWLTGLTARLQFVEIRDGLRFGLKSYVQNMAGNLHERVDIILLAYLLDDPAQVALYAIAVSVVKRLSIVPESLANVLLPRLAGQSREDAAAFTSEVSRHSLTWVIVMAIGLAIVSPVAVPLLFGAEYRGSIPALLVLLPAMIAYTNYRIVARFFIATDRQQANIASELLSLAVNVCLNLWLIPKFGIVGASLASLFSYSLSAVFILLAFKLATGIGVTQMVLPKRADLVPYRKRLAVLRERLAR